MAPEGSPRRAVKIVVAVWGVSYIERFLAFGLASMAAPGNLPAVADLWDVEFVILTAANDFARFRDPEADRQFAQFGAVRLIAIDDLIAPPIFTVTLTLAFMRGMRTFGDGMTDAHFLFWNADFVLSTGSLSHLETLLDQGSKVVLTGSIRAISEDAAPELLAHVDESGVLACSGRELTRLALASPHALQVAKTVNQTGPWALSPNHMFWTVGSDTVLARYWQIFMFCLRPTRALSAIDGYCDYSFVPALCPDEPVHIVDDSDDICLLELQERDQAHEPVDHGPDREARWRESIAEWCTPEHMEVARTPILFHADDVPAAAASVKVESSTYVEAISEAIGQRPAHPGHYYWVSGISAWYHHRGYDAAAPAELETALSLRQAFHPSFARVRRAAAEGATGRRGLTGALWRQVFGDSTAPRPFHPDHAALAALSNEVRNLRRRVEAEVRTCLVVARPSTWIDRLLPPDGTRFFQFDPADLAIWRLAPPPDVSELLIYLRPQDRADPARLLANARAALAPGHGRVTLLLHQPPGANEDGTELFDLSRRAMESSDLQGLASRTVEVGPFSRIYARAFMSALGSIPTSQTARGASARRVVAAILTGRA